MWKRCLEDKEESDVWQFWVSRMRGENEAAAILEEIMAEMVLNR